LGFCAAAPRRVYGQATGDDDQTPLVHTNETHVGWLESESGSGYAHA
jgi:hypothetical protein